MKSFNLFFTAVVFFAATAHASNNYLGKADDRAVVISINPDKVSYASGGKAKFSGTISVTGKKSYDWGSFWDWLFGNKKKGLLEEFQKEGIEVTGSFPSSAVDVSSALKMESNGDDEIKFSYESPSIVVGDLNQLSIRVYNNASDKNRLKQYSAIQAKLERRLAELNNLKNYYHNNRALKEVIAVVEKQIDMFSALIDKIEDQLNSDDNLIAESIRPIQVDNLAGSLNRSMTSINGFRFSAIADSGVPFDGLPNKIVAKISKIGDQDKDDDYYKNLGKYGYVSELYKDGNLVKSQVLDAKTASATIEYSTTALRSLDQNKFELMLYRTEKGKKKSRIGTMIHYINVLSDKVKPTWLASSLPNQEDHFVQTPPSISLVANDSFGRINPDSLSVLFSGKNILGQTVSVNLTSSLLQSKDLDGAQYSWSGAIADLAEGDYSLSANIVDFSKNAAVTYKSRIVIDKTSPRISFANVDGVESVSQAFQLSVSISDASPVESRIFLNDVQISFSSLSSFNVPLSLSPGLNKIIVSTVDKAGNSSDASTSIVFDNTPPVLTQLLPDNTQPYYTNHLPITIPFKISSNEKLSIASVNGSQALLSSDHLFFNRNITVNTAGVQSFEGRAKDIAGNESVVNSSFTLKLDSIAPQISLTQSGVSPTNQPSVPVIVSISDQSPVWSQVIINDLTIFSTAASSFSIPFELTREGSNTFKVVSTDAAGNSMQSNVIEVFRDTVPPILSSIKPENNSDVDRMIFTISGVSNEPLKSAEVDGMDLVVSGNQFTGKYVADRNGERTLDLTFADVAGNVGHAVVAVNIKDVLLVPSLISVVPDPDNIHMWVVGSASSARPGANISVSAALFGNSGSTTVDSDGTFQVKLNKFTNAKVKAVDPNNDESAETTVSFSGTTSLAGTVKDVLGSPLPNVTISFVGSNITTTTDASGNFIVQNPPTGDQTLVIDGSTVPQSTSGADKKFFSTKLAINVGLGQTNQLGAPVFLTPLMLDGSQTSIVSNSAATVTSDYAPGVQLSISSGSTTFPDGSHSGSINLMTIDSSKATTEVPSGFVPTKVISLEPSGTKFSKPVAIAVPNDNDLPAKTPMIFFSMNSAKGKWELDGLGKVSDDGHSVVTNPGSGITHFSLVYAVPLSPVIASIKNPNLLGISASNGGLDNSVRGPSFNILGANIAPTVNYKSGWANPTAVISNIFTIPSDITTTSGTGSGEEDSIYNVQKQSCTTETTNLGLIWWSKTSCTKFWEEWWDKMSYTFKWQATNLWVPDSITSQFFVGSFSSDQVTLNSDLDSQISQIQGSTKISNAAATQILQQTGLPQTSIMSYAVQLKDPATGDYMASGIHPSLARYQIKLKNLTITTNTTKTVETFGRVGNKWVVGTRTTNYDPITTISSEALDYMPSDLQANILVQNKTSSNSGRGWEIGGVQRIYNPTNTTIMVEQGDGSVSTYALNSVISTLFDGSSSGVDLAHGVDLTQWPYALAARIDGNSSSFLSQVNLGSGTISNLNQIPSVSGSLSSQGYYQCGSTTKCDDFGCYPDYSTGQFSSVKYPFKVKSVLGGLARSSSGEVFTTDNLQHALYRNGGVQKIVGQTQSVDDAASTKVINYELYTVYFNSSGDSVKQTCNSLFGADCGAPQVQSARYNCTAANIVRTCTASSGLSQVIKCNYTQEPQYMFTPSVGTIGVAGSGGSGLNAPSFMIGSPDGKLIIADTGNNRVVSVDSISGALTLVAGTGQNVDSGDAGFAVNAGLYHPRGLAFDNSGNLYVSTENGYIRKIDSAGKISTFAGQPVGKGGVVADQAAAVSIAMNNPQGMVFDATYENLYVADTSNNRVLAINLATGIANKVAGTGQCTTDPKDGNPALFANICGPTVLGMDDVNNLLIVDSGHNKIRRVTFSAYSSGVLSYMPSAPDFSRLLLNTNGTWTRQYRDGSYASFDSDGYQALSTDKVGRVTQFIYDSNHNLTEVKYPNGQSLRYTYSGGNLSSITDPAGRTTNFTYSGTYLANVSFPDGTSRGFQYDANGQMISEVDQEGHRTSYEYNAWNRLQKVTRPDATMSVVNDIASQTMSNNFNGGNVGNSAGIGFDEGQISTQVTDGNSITTEMTQDHMGFISAIKDPLGNITTVKRDSLGKPTLVTRADGTSTTYTYDPNTAELLSVKDNSTGLTTSSTYDASGKVLTRTDGNGKTTSFQYDATTGLLLQVSQPDGLKLNYEYNSLGLVTKKIVSKGSTSNTVIFAYDSLGHLSQVTDNGGNVQNIVSDLAGNQAQVSVTADGTNILTTTFEYDAFNRVLQVKSPKSEITKYSYLGTGQLSKVLDSKGQSINYNYDVMGRLLQKTNSQGGIYSFAYDGNSNRIQESDPNGNVKRYTFDLLNRLVQADLPDDVLKLQYNSIGQLVSASNKVSSLSFNSDSLGRVTSSSVTGLGAMASYPVVPMAFTYDGNANRTSLSSQIANFSYNFDFANRLTSVQNSFGENFISAYDDIGRLTTFTRPGSGNKSIYSYNSSNLISQIANFGGGVQKDTTILNYDHRNFITSKTNQFGQYQFILDENGQLTSSTNPNLTGSEMFSYDELGNRISDASGNFNYDSRSQRLLDDGQHTYMYDNNGNVTSKVAKDSSKESYKYIYNSKNQLVKIQALAGLSSAVIRESSFTYDVLGRRMQKSVYDTSNTTDPSKTYTHNFIYDGMNLLGEYDGNGNVLAIFTNKPTTYDDVYSVNVTSAGVSAKIAQRSGSFFYMKDHLGSITSVADLAGNILQRYDYKVFGEIAFIKDNAGNDIKAQPILNTSFGFTGREHEEESGLIYLRARYYDPNTGRFLQQDPYAGRLFEPFTVVNKYNYASNSPVNIVDPTGYDGEGGPVGTITYNPNGSGGANGGPGDDIGPGHGTPLGNSTNTQTGVITSTTPPVNNSVGMDQVPFIIANYEMAARNLAIDGVSAWTLIVSDRQTKFAGDEAYAAAEHYLYAKESVAQGESAAKVTTLSVGYQLMKLIYTGEGQTPPSLNQLKWEFSGVLRGLDLRDVNIPASNTSPTPGKP